MPYTNSSKYDTQPGFSPDSEKVYLIWYSQPFSFEKSYHSLWRNYWIVFFYLPWWYFRNVIIQKIKTEFARGKSSHSRMLFLKICEMAICLFSKVYFKQNFYSELLCLSQDSVANIRLKVRDGNEIFGI